MRGRLPNSGFLLSESREQNKNILSTAMITALTVFSGGGAVLAADSLPITVPDGTSKDIDVTATGGSIKSGINVQGTSNTVSATFSSGTLNILNTDNYNYSAIMTEANGVIGTLNANISGTTITVNGGKAISGSLIKSMNEITSITADVRGNTLSSSGSVTGGLVSVESIGTIGGISGAGFSTNRLTVTSSGEVTGGVLYNQGVLGSISTTSFSGNTVQTSSGNVSGGAFGNVGELSGNISGVSFTDNTITSSSGNAFGGAVYNTGLFGGKILNSTFTGNIANASGGIAHGGAIYTTTDLVISGDGGTTRFSGNKVLDSSGSRNEGIYVDSRIAKLTLETLRGGSVLIYDDISGGEGYNLTINGDSSGKIGLYGNVTNANLTVSGGNLDFVNSATTDFTFGQMSSSSGAKYSIDLNVGTGKADTFSVGAGSSGLLTINSLNILGELPDVSKQIKILTSDGANSIGISLTQNAINNFNRSETRLVSWSDEVPVDLSFGDLLYDHERTDTIHKSISVVASVYGGLIDSLQYTVTTSEGNTTSVVRGDTLRLMNQSNSTGVRSFRANASRNTHTVSENLGSTGTGTFNVVGLRDTVHNEITTEIDANGHTLFKLDKASTLGLSDVRILNAPDVAGSILNITNKNAVVNLSNISINDTNGSNGIINNGTLNFDRGTSNIYTSITGTGTINIHGGSLQTQGPATITQSVINILGGNLQTPGNKPVQAKVNISSGAGYYVQAGNIKGAVTNNGTLGVYSGTLSQVIDGSGTTVIMKGHNVTANSKLGNKVTMQENSVLNISADNVGGNIAHYGSAINRSIINLTSGTLNYAITGTQGKMYITGDVISNALISSSTVINTNSSLRIAANNLQMGSLYTTNNGSLYLTKGSTSAFINGSGTIYIVGEVRFDTVSYTQDKQTVSNNISIESNGILTSSAYIFTGGSITNNGVLNLVNGTLSKTVSGTGVTNITGSVISHAGISSNIDIKSAGELTISGSNIKGDVNNSGKLVLSGGTLEKEILGTGTTKFTGATTINALIDQTMTSGASISLTFNKADYIGANISGSDNTMYLGSGTLSHKISNIRVLTASNANIVFGENAKIDSYFYVNGSSASVTLNAAQLGHYLGINGGNVYLTGGKFGSKVTGGGRLNITGTVEKTGGQLAAPITITNTGNFTAAIIDSFTGAITNNGIFNMSGVLNRNIAGTGTAKIYGTSPMVFTKNAGISGILDFNGGTLSTEDKAIQNYSIGKVTGNGTWSLNFDAASQQSDTFTLAQASSGVITPDITLLNVSTTFQNKVFQVLKGNAGVSFNLGTGTKTVNLVNREEDFVTSGDVYFDKTYEIRDKMGTGSATLSLATTDKTNDSIKMSLNSINWGETIHTRKDLLHDWLSYSAPVKNFNFKTSSDVFNVSDHLYDAAISTTVNINGVASGAARSKIDFGTKYVGFRVNNGGKFTLSNVEITRLGMESVDRIYMSINSGGWAAFNNVKYSNNHVPGYHILVKNGGVIDNYSGEMSSGGGYLLRSEGGTINNISATFSNSSLWGYAISSTGTIGSINNSIIQAISVGLNGNKTGLGLSNTGTINSITNTQFNRNYMNSSVAGNLSGSAIANTNLISNFSGNTFTGNYIKVNSPSILSIGRGAALYNTATIANGIVDSTFTGNYINAAGGFGGALYNSGTLKVIDNNTFTGNYIKYNPNVSQSAHGGAIYNTGTITEGIKDSTFDGNYVEGNQLSSVANAAYNVMGGAIYSTGKVLNIVNSNFINNHAETKTTTGYAQGGALYGIFNITGGLFENNYVSSQGTSYTEGGAIYFSGGTTSVNGATFRENRARSGGAIYVGGVGTITNSIFESNSSEVYAGAILNRGTLSVIDGSFTNNTATTYGGAINGDWNNTISKIDGTTFTNNSAGYGGAVSSNNNNHTTQSGIHLINNSIFNGNHASNHGGAVYSSGTSGAHIKKIFGSRFEGNYVSSTGTGYGGAISALAGGVTDGIYNSVFRNNYISGKTNAYGGAIYTIKHLKIGAENNGLTEFTGNYTQVNGGAKNYQAVYVNYADRNATSLTLSAVTNGVLLFNDSISGAANFRTHITGDGSGRLKLFNNIFNSKIAADNIYFDTSNNKIFNYNFLSLNTADTVKYKLDINMADGTADNFTLGYGSTGVMTIDDLNFMGTSTQNRVFQIIKNERSDVELAFSKTRYGNYNVVDNFLESSVPNTVYNDGDYRQQSGLILSTTDTYHDSIEYIASETRYDPLSIIVGKETSSLRSLVFRNGNGITLGSDLGTVTSGSLSIVGTSAKNTISGNGHNLFNLSNETTLTLSNINLTGTTDLIRVSNGYAVVNLNDTNITGNIKGVSGFKLNLGGVSNHIDGVVSDATTTLNSGTLTFNRNTFADSGKLVANGGTIDFKNDTVENFVINDLSSTSSARYDLDINLNDFTSDTITIKNNSASGVVTIGNINYLGNLTLDDIGKHPIKVLNTTSSSITLALSDEVKAKSFVLGDIRRTEQDTVAMVTNFDTVYYNYYRLGNVVGKLSVSPDSSDSITINAVDEWNSERVATSVLGDTLELVAKSDLAVRILQANKSTDAYNVGTDIGTVTKGELVISGVNDGVESSTINLANHKGFVLGKDTSLSINSAKIIGSDTPIEITDSSARVELNDAYLGGGIKSNVRYDLNLIGNGTTIVDGTLTNANATLSRGGFIFNKDTFAGANTSLKVDGGTVLMNNGKIEDYVFNNLVSSAGAGYAIDIDLANAQGDTFNVKSGSGVISINSFTVMGDLIEANQEYHIKLLNSNGNPVTLAISDALLSQLKDDFKLGACITTEYETLNPITKWNTVYHKDETTHDILGRFKLNDAKDSIVVTPKNIVALGTQTLVWDDTLKLWNQLESSSAKQFNFDTAGDVYKVSANLGSSSSGTMSVSGKASGSSLSTINAQGNTLFELPNSTTLNLSNLQITGGRNAAGSILNLTNSNAKVNINNVTLASTGGSNGINNAGTITFTGGTNTINTGISGTSGTLVISNGSVVNVGSGANITQSRVNVSNGSLILAASDIIYGDVSIGTSGSATMSGSAITQALSNSGALSLLGGTLAFGINGSGQTTVTGALTSRAAINQALTVATGGSLTISASNIGGAVSNSNSVILTGGDLTKVISGSGKTTIRGNVNVNSSINQAIDITSEGALTANASNIGGVVTNARELNLTSGVLNKNVSGSGRTNIDGNVTINSTISGNTIHLNSGVLSLGKTSNISGATQLNVHDGGISLVDNSVNTTNLGNLVLNNDLDLSIDAALGSKSADVISATSLSNADNHSIIITSIKVISDTTDSLPIEILVADNVLRGAIKLSSDVISVQGSNTRNNYLVTYSKDNGKLTFAYGSLSTAITLTTADRQYNLAADETSSLGVESGDGSTLTVNGNNHTLTVSSGGQWTIGTNKTVNLNNITVSGADTTAIVNSGTLNLNNISLTENTKDITNNGSVSFSGTNVFDKIDGTGSSTITSGQTTVSGTLTQGSLTVNSSGTLKNNGTTTVSLSNAGTVNNSGSLVVTGGTNTGAINGSGTTTINGNFTNSSTLNQSLVVNSGKTLTNSGTVTGSLNNKGTIANGNILKITSGTNTGTINGSGTTTIDGNFTNSSIMNQTLVVNSGKTLTNSGTVTGSLNNKGTIANGNILKITGGTNTGTINGSGTTTVDGDFENRNIIKNSLVVNANKTLTNSGDITGALTNAGTIANGNILKILGGVNTGTINGSGTTTVDGNFENRNIIKNNLVVNADKTLTNSGEITGALTNSGTIANGNILKILGGVNTGTINGSGTTTVDGDFENRNIIKNNLVVNADKTLTNSGEITGALTNSGTLENGNILKISGGTNTGTITGSGTTTIDGNFTNSSIMNQTLVVNSGKTLTNSGEITGALTNSGTLENGNILKISSGTNTGTITGSGTTTIDGNFTNSSIMNQTLVVNSGKTLTNSGNVTGSITNAGTITNTNTLSITGGTNSGKVNNNSGTMTAENLKNNSGAIISNAGQLNLSGGSNSGTINGSGTTTVTGDYSNTSIITQGVLGVNSGKTLTNSGTITAGLANNGTIVNGNILKISGGTNAGVISGTGSTTIDGNLTNSGEIVQNTLTISSEKKLTNADDGSVTVNTILNNNSEIANNGTLTIKGTNNLGTITGSGTLNVAGTLTVNKAITQGNVNIASDSKLTNNSGLTSNLLNNGTFDNNAIFTGTLTNKGTASSSADNLAGNVTNSGTLRLEGETYGDYEITGDGSTLVLEDLINNGSITQNDITLESGKTLTNNSGKTIIANNNFTNLGDIYNNGTLSGSNFVNSSGSSISNSGTLNFNGGMNSGVISGGGVLNISGTVTNTGAVAQGTINNTGNLTNTSTITGNIINFENGTITSVSDNLVGEITNSGTLNLNGGKTQGNISGEGGLINVNGDLAISHEVSGNTLSLNSGSSVTLTGGSLDLEGLNANGGSINAQNNTLDSINLGDVVLNDDLNVSIDADLATKSADSLTGSSLVSNGHSIIIDSINVLTDATEDMAFEINIADEILRECIKLSGESIAVAGVKDNVNYVVTYSSSTGNLTFTYGDLDSALHLTASQRNYTLGSDEIITKDLGAMDDGQDVLTINGNNHSIIGNGHNGIIIKDDNTLNVNNISGMKGFVTALDNRSDGNLNVSNTTFTDNETDILNAGKLTFGGTNVLDTLKGSGTTSVNNGQTTVNELFEQGTLEIKSTGSLINNGTFEVTTLTNSGTFKNVGSAEIETLANNASGILVNTGDMTLSGGTNAGRIEGTGTVDIAGNVTNSGTFGQGQINIIGGVTLTNSGTVTGVLSNSGTIANGNILKITGGVNTGTIEGEGTTTVDGDFENRNIIKNNLVVNADKILTNSGTVTGALTNDGTIVNGNILKITGGVNTGTIEGEGTTTVDGDFENRNIIKNDLVVNADKTLTNSGEIIGVLTNSGTIANGNILKISGGVNTGTIEGEGTTTVDGDFENRNIIKNNLVVNADKTLTNSGEITGVLTNSGTIANGNILKITGGVNTGTIEGEGTTTIDGDFENRNIIKNNLVVNADKVLTNSGEIIGVLTNSGTIANGNILKITGGANDGTIEGEGTTTVDGDFENRNIIKNNLVVNADKTLTNSGTVTGALTNDGTIVNGNILKITGGTNRGTINGEGVTNISGNFVNSGNIAQSTINNSGNLVNNSILSGNIINFGGGIITSSSNNLVGEITNSGTLNLTGGTTQGNIGGNGGTINANGNLTVSHNVSGNTLSLNSGSVSVTDGVLNLEGTTGNGGSLNSQNDKFDTMNLGNVILNQDLSISIDADLSEKWADSFVGTSVSGSDSESIVISNINILAGSSDKMPVSLTVTNDNLKENVKLDGALRVETDESIKDSYLISYGKDTGELKFEYSTLPVAVHSDTEQKVYVMSHDEVISFGDFGEFGGKTLSINGSGNTISGVAGVEGLIVETDQELSFNDLTYSGFETGVTNNSGTLNITDTKFENNTTDIVNESELNFYGEDFITTVTGGGTTNVSSYKKSDGTIVNSTVTLNEGGSFTQSTLNIDSNNKFVSNGTVNVETLTNKGIYTNNTTLSLNSGSSSGSIVGKGDLDINGKFTSSGVIDQNTLKVNEDAEFTVALDKVTTIGNNITNEGTLFASSGSNSLNIEGGGRTEIVGDVTNTGTIEQKSVTVADGGKLTTSLDNLLTDEIINSGALHVSDGKIHKNISGTKTGTVHIDHTMFLDSTISGTGVALNDGVLTFGHNANLAHSSNFIVNGGRIDLINNRAIDSINLGEKLTLNKDLDLFVDVDLGSGSMDKISADSLSGDGYINIKYMNVLSDADENKTRVEFANDALKKNVKTDVKTLSFSPIWMYGVDYDKTTGEFLFTKGGNGAGGGYKAFNPAVLASPVATQISGHLTMSQTISEAFEHSDWYFRLPRNARFARMHGNEYAISTDYNGNLGSNYSNEGIWSRPYSNFESVNLGGGPKVNVMSYGTIAGGDSDFRKLSNGWAYVSSAYVGYNGSQFNYDGVSTTSNGGMLGMTATFYKGNFYTGLTATAGAGFSETHNMYGKEELTMLMGGIASKSGYNIELNDGKFIIQPNLLMSYSFVGTFNYTNSAGVKIDNDPMHTIQLAPSLRFIGNTKSGWQPYATVGMVWNIMNETQSRANGYRLPEMSTRPYIEYGLGLQKLWNDNFSAYGQAVMRNGGRTGVSLSLGFKWNIGKEHSSPLQKVDKTTPSGSNELPVNTIKRAPLPSASLPLETMETPSTKPERTIIKQLSTSEAARLGLKRDKSSVTLTSRDGHLRPL